MKKISAWLKNYITNISENRKILDIIIGIHYTLVHIEGDLIGISSTYTLNSKLNINYYINRNLTTYNIINNIQSPIGLDNSIAYAVCNAILINENIKNISKTGDVFKYINIQHNSKILMIGFIKPLLNKLETIVKKDNIYILERSLVRWQKNYKIYPDTSLSVLVNKANLIIASGQTFTNNTLDYILYLKNKNIPIIIVGPSTLIDKNLKEEFNINLLSGIYIKKENIKKAKEIIKLGGGTRDINKISEKVNL